MIIHPDMGIDLSDGARLSARVWMPESAKADPVPAILEYLPYRKSDGTAARDHGMHLHFAKAGYVCLRVDRRGCGDSEGLFDDEYSEEELRDGVEVINWIARQPWCDGSVGIQGISWGGFNGLQLAARAPESLKAVISIGTTADRYHDDIHYKGGIQLTENIGWAATAMSWFSMPPDPLLAGHNNWRGIWLERLRQAPFLADTWMNHPNRDDYWRHGSICEEYHAIKAPVLVMGGLHDGYRNAMAAMVENLKCPVKGIVGPWSHKYPNISTIEPSIDYLGEALRWWDHWLKGKDTGVADDPAYRAYLMDSIKPAPSLDFRPGRWVACRDWPSTNTMTETFEFLPNQDSATYPFLALIETDLACGRNSGEFFPFGFGPGELPDNQRHDDALSGCVETARVPENREILGAPSVTFGVASNTHGGQVIARLTDVHPDGSSSLITMGALNLRHRHDFQHPQDMVPGKVYQVSIVLDQSAYRLPRDHRLRVALSASYWPYFWPEGETSTLSISALSLTVPWYRKSEDDGWSFDPPVEMEKRRYRQLRDGDERKEWYDDPDTGTMVLEIFGDHGTQEDHESGLITESAVSERWEINRSDPTSAGVEIIWTRSLGRAGWKVSSKVTTRMRGEADQFVVEQRLEAFEDDQVVVDRHLESSVPR